MQKFIIQLRTDPAFDVINTSTGEVVSVWNTENAAAIDAAYRVLVDLREARRAAKEQRKGRANDDHRLCYCKRMKEIGNHFRMDCTNG